jgi:hypothetical protein
VLLELKEVTPFPTPVASAEGSSRSSSSWSFEIGGVLCRGVGGGDAGWSVVPSEDKLVSSSSTAESNNGSIFGSETISSSRIVLDLGVALSTFASLSNDGWNNRGLCRVPIFFGGNGVLTAFLLRCVGAFGGVVAAILELDIVADLGLGEGGDWTIGNGAELDIVADLVLGEGGDWTIGNVAFFWDDLDDLVGILFFSSSSVLLSFVE